MHPATQILASGIPARRQYSDPEDRQRSSLHRLRIPTAITY